MSLVVGRVSDTPTGKLQRTPPCGRCVSARSYTSWVLGGASDVIVDDKSATFAATDSTSGKSRHISFNFAWALCDSGVLQESGGQ